MVASGGSKDEGEPAVDCKTDRCRSWADLMSSSRGGERVFRRASERRQGDGGDGGSRW